MYFLQFDSLDVCGFEFASGGHVEKLLWAGGEIVKGKYAVQDNGIAVAYM